jgi:CoA-transferase family III
MDGSFKYASCAARVRKDHPLRPIPDERRRGVRALSQEFLQLYLPIARASMVPEKLLYAVLLQAFHSVRLERQLRKPLGKSNPGLVYCALSGFGRTGPYGDRGGFDLVAQAMSGNHEHHRRSRRP